MYRVVTKRENAHDDSVWAVAFGAGCIVTGGVDETLKVWDEKDLARPKFTFKDNELAIVGVDTTGDGKTAVTSSMDGQLRVYDLVEGKKVTSINAGAVETWTVACNPKRDALVATGTHSGAVGLWDVKAGKRVQSLTGGESKFALSVAWSPSGALVAAGAADGVVQVYDAETGKVLHKLPGHMKAVRGLAFSPDSQTLLTASEDNHLNAYDMKGGNQTATYGGHSGWVLDVDVSSSGKHFASCGADRKVKIWDFANTKECVHTFDANDDSVWSCAWAADGQRLAAASEDHSLQLFEVKDK